MGETFRNEGKPVVRSSQITNSGLEGLCESPHDFPPRWAAMFFAYLDESTEQGDSFVVVAGFVGKKSAWVSCVRKWRKALKKHGREHLHMKELRFRKDRHKELLSDLGGIPASCGLRLVFGGVNVGTYKPLVAGKVIEVQAAGDLFAFQIALLASLKDIPKGQRLEAISESQKEYGHRRGNVCAACSEIPEFKFKEVSKLAKWGEMPKSTILEPADFAAFAILQKLRNPKSNKAILCSPILENKLIRGAIVNGQQANKILTELMAEDPTFMEALLNPNEKQAFIKALPIGEEFKKGLKEILQ